MKATMGFVKSKYIEFNELIFDRKLPEIPVYINKSRTMMGVLRYEKRRNWLGKIEYKNFRIYISSYYDLPEKEIEDTLIHEMIHLFINYNRIKDSSSHGPVFRRMMLDINKKFGRKITVSHKSDLKLLDSDDHCKPHYICETIWKNDKRYITCVAQSKLFEFNEFFHRQSDCICIRWWFSKDSYFNRYPSCRTPKLYKISEEDYKIKVANATECVCDRNRFQPKF